MKRMIALLLSLAVLSSAQAEPIKQIIFFGDSLSDNGNLYSTTLKVLPKSPPYYAGRFSNGPTWAEIVGNHFQDKFGIGSQNFAVGGTTAVWHNPLSGYLPYVINQEINHYLIENVFSEDTESRSKNLYVIWAGGNDYLFGQPDVNGATDDVVQGVIGAIEKLRSWGATKFLVFNLPDLSKTPYTKTVDYGDNLHELSLMHNQKFQVEILKYQEQHQDTKLVFVDAYHLFEDLTANPEAYNKKYNKNIKNTSDACWDGGYTLKRKNKLDEVNELSAELQKARAGHKLMVNGAEVDPQRMAQYIVSTPGLETAYSTGKLYADDVLPCANPDEYTFWDKIHPTAVIHQIMAEIVLEKLLESGINN